MFIGDVNRYNEVEFDIPKSNAPAQVFKIEETTSLSILRIYQLTARLGILCV